MIESTRAVVAITVVAAVIFVGTAVTGAGLPDQNPTWFVVLIGLNTLPLLAVRRNPLVILAVFSVAYPLWVAAEFGTAMLQSLPTLVAIFAAGAWQRPLWLRATALLSPVWMMAAAAAGLWDVGLVDLGYVALVLGGVWALGMALAERQAYATALEARTAELQVARRELADRAVADERARIARANCTT